MPAEIHPGSGTRHHPTRPAALPLLACAAILACGPAPDGPVLDLPPRPEDAPGGSVIVEEIGGLDLADREARIHAEFARGNIPGWLRRFSPVEMTVERDGRTHAVTFWAAPDYLAVGSDDDHFYVPLSPGAARRIAELAGASLPTPRMVDAIWASARVRLVPIRLRPDENMATVRYFRRHDRLVQAQRSQRGARAGSLVAGHKLDVVVPARRAAATDSPRTAVYGWHRSDGSPIQPLYEVAADSRPYFSMGVRLVHRTVLVDGVERDMAAMLRDPGLARLLGRR